MILRSISSRPPPLPVASLICPSPYVLAYKPLPTTRPRPAKGVSIPRCPPQDKGRSTDRLINPSTHGCHSVGGKRSSVAFF
jgi:hypothetical protein